MVSPYKKQRKNIQEAFENLGLITPLINDELPLEIIEDKQIGTDKLQKLIIKNIPAVNDIILPVSYLVDLELNHPVIGTVEHTKRVEKAIFIYTLSSLFVILIEMKEAIQGKGNDAGISAIEEKFEHSISRINLLLTSYIFLERYENVRIRYFGIVAYNNDKVSPPPESLMVSKMEQILKSANKNGKLWIEDIFGNPTRLQLFFIKNGSGNPKEFEIDLDELFDGNTDFETAQYNEELSLPKITK